MAPICRFWAKGQCRNGDQCRFEHPPRDRDGFRNDNRFAALQTPEQSLHNNQGRSNNDRSAGSQPSHYSLSRDGIIADLSTERPQWILSAYGPGLKAPIQLFGGPEREYSFEEIRLRHYEARGLGNPSIAIQYEDQLNQNAQAQIQNALNDIGGAIEYVRKAENEHPNRNDTCNDAMTSTNGQPNMAPRGSTINPFHNNDGSIIQASAAFGSSSVLGGKVNPFGKPGQQAAQSGTFGQPSVLGSKPNPFAVSAGGSHSFPAAKSTTAPFGQFTEQADPFGQPMLFSQTSNPNRFAQTQPLIQNNPFGVPSQLQPANPNPFGQPSQLKEVHPINHSSIPVTVNAFGQPSQSVTNPFAQDRTQNSAMTTQVNPFVSAPAPQRTPFEHVSHMEPTPNLLSTNHSTQAAASTTATQFQPAHNPPVKLNGSQNNSTGDTAKNPYPPDASTQHPALQSYASRDASGKLVMFKGKTVIYKDAEAGFRNRDGSWEKIWFPDGAPVYSKDTELADAAYDADTKASYDYFRETGSFEGGVMPLLPPRREWCVWDF